jgi:hypothetical protein
MVVELILTIIFVLIVYGGADPKDAQAVIEQKVGLT